jgi:phosphoenolpyruvate-protein kinase (PTS system EI component)
MPRQGKGVSVCGEMAGDVAFTRLLLGLGLRSFSMHPSQILAVKQEVLRADTQARSLVLRLAREQQGRLDPAEPRRRARRSRQRQEQPAVNRAPRLFPRASQ